jgi:hypothetical protein
MNEDDARRRSEAFVREVEAAMGDLPPRRRTELTAGLADHLLEPRDDGLRLIDDELDARAYADELRAVAPVTSGRPNRGRVPLLVGAGLLAVVVAVGAWLGYSGLSSRGFTAEEPTTATSSSPEPTLVTVPDVRGLSAEEALDALASAYLTAEVLLVDLSEGNPDPALPRDAPPDTVLLVDPHPGTRVAEESVVIVMVSS